MSKEAPNVQLEKRSHPESTAPSKIPPKRADDGGRHAPLTPAEIFKRIQPKTCKIVTSHGEGTGYLLDSSTGLLMSSFHLVGSVMMKHLNKLPFALLPILKVKGYITQDPSSSQWYLTEKVSTLTNPKELDLKNVSCVKSCGMALIVSSEDWAEKKYEGEKLFSFVSNWISSQPENLDLKVFRLLKKAYFDRYISLMDSNDPIEIHMDGEVFYGEVALPQGNKDRLVNFAKHDTALIRITQLPDGRPYPDPAFAADFGGKIPELSSQVKPTVGETVYYAGYPLGHEELLCSKGMVSCVTSSNNKETLVLEAPIAPGNSGGPVFVVRDGSLFFVGLISSEVAQVSEKIRVISDQLKNYKGVSLNSGGINLTETQNLLGVGLTETVLGNLSTGKGNAIRVTFNDLITDIPDLDIVRRDIFREAPQFFVPRRIKPETREPIRLFEFVTAQGILRLHASELRRFLDLYADNTTKMSANHFFSNLTESDYIDFSCYEHVWPEGDMLSSDASFNSMLNVERSDAYDKNQAEAALKSLYDFAINVGLGRIKKGQYIHGPTASHSGLSGLFVTRKSMLAEKFFQDHMCGQNNRQNRSQADLVAAKRGPRITVSTTLTRSSEQTLGKEVLSLQGFYAFVQSRMNDIAKKDGAIKGLFYLTLSSYKMQIRSSKPGKPTQIVSPFLYSTKQAANGMHYMYHFAETSPKDSWVAFDGSIYPEASTTNVPKVFYHH